MKRRRLRAIRWRTRFVVQATVAAFAAAMGTTSTARAQTDYYNTDTGRPLTIEDASATELYAFEFQLAPLRLERSQAGLYRWEVEPEIAYGVLPRTQFEIGAPLVYLDTGRGLRASSLAGLKMAVLHSLNVETRLPALAVSGFVLLPVGGAAPDEIIFSAKAIATRTFSWARFHVNAEVSLGGSSSVGDVGTGASEVQDWLGGIAFDKSFPLRSTLMGGEIFVTKAKESDASIWNTAIGLRRQISPAFTVDTGIGKQLSGERAWFLTIGLAHAFAVRSLIPGG